MAGLGLFGSSIEGYGCAGMNAVSYGLICQELERGDSGLRSFVSVQSSLCMYPIYTYGSEEQKQKWLPRMATRRGDRLLRPHRAARRLRPGQHEDARQAPRQGLGAQRREDVDHQLADRRPVVVWAKTDEGIRGFLVENGTKGLAAPEIENKFSLRASITGAIFFEDVVVPEENMLPGSVCGIKAPLSCLTQARYGITWGVIGAAQACLAQLLDYSQTRILFGRPLAATQAIQIRLAEMARKITTAQLLSLQLGRLKDAGTMSPSQVSLAKWNNCRMALDVARDARDILGGAGISAEYVPIRHALNLESVITYEGTETIHQLTIGRELTGINAF